MANIRYNVQNLLTKIFMKFSIFFIAILFAGCVAVSEQTAEVGDTSAKKLTVGTVQKEIRIGMNAVAVAEVLGTPNIVSTDEQGEVWIYDRVATEEIISKKNTWIFAVIAGGTHSNRVASRTQRSLTIIVKFDEENKVRDFAYRSSQF